MFNPPSSYPDSGSYAGILKRMIQSVQHNQVDDQILEILQKVFEKELGKENIVLSRPERVRLYQQVTKTILTDVLEKIDDAK